MDYAEEKTGDVIKKPSRVRKSVTEYETMVNGIKPEAVPPQMENTADKKPAIRKISFYDEHHPVIRPEVEESGTDEPSANDVQTSIEISEDVVSVKSTGDPIPAIRKISFFDEHHPTILPEVGDDEPRPSKISEDAVSIKSLGDGRPAVPKRLLRKMSADAILSGPTSCGVKSRARGIPALQKMLVENVVNGFKIPGTENSPTTMELTLQTSNLEMDGFHFNGTAPTLSTNPEEPQELDSEMEATEYSANQLEKTEFKPEVPQVPYPEQLDIVAESMIREMKRESKNLKKRIKGIMKETKNGNQPELDINFTYIPKLELLDPNFNGNKGIVGSPAVLLDDYNTVQESPFHDFDRVKGGNGLPDGLHLTELATGSGVGLGGDGGGQESRRGALLAAFVACLGAAALGTVIGYASPAIPDINRHPSPFHLNGVQQMAWVASMIALGEMVGGGLSGPVLDKYGRKLVIIANTVPFIVGWLIIAAAPNVEWLFVGRFVTGFCAGVVDVAVPVYLAEVSPADIRGFVGSCYELFVNLGIFFVFGFGCLVPYNWLAIACAFVPTVMMILMCFMPETPRFLMSKGNQVGAQQALTILRGPKADTSKELNEIIDNIQQSSGEVTWRDFIQPTLYKPLYIILGLMLIQQFSGYGVVYEYTVTIFSSAGINMDPNLQTAIVGLSGVLSNLVSAFLVDRTGRKAMLLVSASIMAVSMAAMGAFFITKEYDAHFALTYISWLPILSLVSYNAGLNVGFGPIPFYMAGELFPLKTRGITCGICIAIWSLFFFLVSRYFMEITLLVHDYGAYWILSGVSVMAIFFVIVVVPETKGKTLEEIEDSFRSH